MPATLQQVSKRLLRDLGVVSLNPASPAEQAHPIEATDLDDVLAVIHSAYDEIWEEGPLEMRQRPGSGFLRAPVNLTLSVTNGSETVSAVTTYASWMAGCTVRIAGEEGDNQFVNATLLARPFTGTTGATTATVYGDAVTLATGIDKVIAPLSMHNRGPLHYCATLEEFQERTGMPMMNGIPYATTGGYGGSRLSVSCPSVWMIEGYYSFDLGTWPKRIRFGPLPDRAYTVTYQASYVRPEYEVTNINEPDVVIPLPNILEPVARQHLTSLPTFKNAEAKAEIARQYRLAIKKLKNSRAGVAVQRGIYQ
jgi:hypothetical protein